MGVLPFVLKILKCHCLSRESVLHCSKTYSSNSVFIHFITVTHITGIEKFFTGELGQFIGQSLGTREVTVRSALAFR